MSVAILLADDHQMIRQGLRALVEAEPDFKVVGEAEDGRKAMQLAAELSPDVLVMDVRMPELNGIEATRQTIAAHAGIKVVGLSAHSDEQMTVEMLRAGASGYVLKSSAFEELATAIRTVVKNKVYLSPALTGAMVDGFIRGGNGRTTAFGALSPREREVLQLIAEGRSTKEVASHLSVSIKTVETHRRNMMEKLNVDSVAELTKYAIREGIISL